MGVQWSARGSELWIQNYNTFFMFFYISSERRKEMTTEVFLKNGAWAFGVYIGERHQRARVLTLLSSNVVSLSQWAHNIQISSLPGLATEYGRETHERDPGAPSLCLWIRAKRGITNGTGS